jgi:hypothetical protein
MDILIIQPKENKQPCKKCDYICKHKSNHCKKCRIPNNKPEKLKQYCIECDGFWFI